MKKRERMSAMERDRFARNLALMASEGKKGCGAPGNDDDGGEDDAGGGGGGGGMMGGGDGEAGGGGGGGGGGEGKGKEAQGEVTVGSASKERWAAIRGFIGQTMERRVEGVALVGGVK